jgi:2-polyprenyl-3-methyl-5-hydroxy-6-metoxy-1,4-benzoquinol methylase
VRVDLVELQTVKELVRLEGRRVLEMGCGDGRFTYLYAHEAEYVLGVDPKREEIRTARHDRPPELARRVQFRVAKTVDPPRRRFDVAVFSWSL